MRHGVMAVTEGSQSALWRTGCTRLTCTRVSGLGNAAGALWKNRLNHYTRHRFYCLTILVKVQKCS